jgi:hypothetical protein
MQGVRQTTPLATSVAFIPVGMSILGKKATSQTKAQQTLFIRRQGCKGLPGEGSINPMKSTEITPVFE